MGDEKKTSQEQAIGQILLWLQGLQQQIYELERREARGDFVVSDQSNEGREAGGEARA